MQVGLPLATPYDLHCSCLRFCLTLFGQKCADRERFNSVRQKVARQARDGKERSEGGVKRQRKGLVRQWSGEFSKQACTIRSTRKALSPLSGHSAFLLFQAVSRSFRSLFLSPTKSIKECWLLIPASQDQCFEALLLLRTAWHQFAVDSVCLGATVPALASDWNCSASRGTRT